MHYCHADRSLENRTVVYGFNSLCTEVVLDHGSQSYIDLEVEEFSHDSSEQEAPYVRTDAPKTPLWFVFSKPKTLIHPCQAVTRPKTGQFKMYLGTSSVPELCEH